MKISVIVPYRDSARWIGRCCESLKSQHGEFEFVFIDDNSIDDGRKIVEGYVEADDRFVSLSNKHGAGVSGARNTGIDYATGEYIAFLDADDEMLECAYGKFMSVINSNPEIKMFQFNHVRYYSKLDKSAIKYANVMGIYRADKLPLTWYYVWNKLFRKDLLSDVRFDETLQFGEDQLFVLECLLRCEYFYHAEKEILVVKHRFENKQSLSKAKKSRDVYKQIRALEDFLNRTQNAEMRQAICRTIGEIWTSPPILELIAEDYEDDC